MAKILFRHMKPEEMDIMLPRLFQILYTNMSKIAPAKTGYAEDLQEWLNYIVPALKNKKCQILLMYAGENLAGYFQYSVEGNTLFVEELEIRPEYQRTMVFYRFCQYMLLQIPEEVKYITSYVHKDNKNSLSIHTSLGMEPVGENKSGTSWCFRGEIMKAAAQFMR